ncbi:ABC superfamily ATP binding cassette transporter, ABC protein [Lacticaseibacillus brantae DSM 23927]|uniref:ABC superfamily ATP binding cassette transporter, ABC protein n=2 Tax=Lacticaseibacillus brantae TaxID=943673 RepID=A0A0R2B8Q7_9LACO|nr:ABC superfamily ATP binding cassette transporter, ABC protein [Lacticaseibacillus brantae DSM 23927]
MEVSGLTKNFGQFHALKGISFEVQPGEVFGYIGPNGAGKSTTIRTLLGILKPTAGTAQIFGQDAWRDAVAIHRRLAYVPGDVYLWPNLTGGEMIDLLLKLGGQKHSAETDELIERFELDPSKKSRTYSKGNRQKVALIAAFSSQPELLILDEPTSGLDPLNEATFQAVLGEFKANGGSTLLSSHILSEVERLADRIAILRDGQIIETGTLAEMRHLTATTVTVKTIQPLPDLSKVAGVTGLQASGHHAAFQVSGDALAQVTALLAQAQPESLTAEPPTLEDLFLHYYREKPVNAHD